MSTMADEVTRYRAELSDIYSDRWADQLFLIWQNEAVVEVFNYRPELFQSIVITKLTPGSMQKPCNCEKFYGVTAITDGAGNVLCYPKAVNLTSLAFFCSPCGTGGAGSNGSVTKATDCPTVNFNPAIPGVFEIVPPLGAGVDLYARVTCANPPVPVCNLSDQMCLHASVYPTVRAYVKAMAYATEKESATSKAWFDTWITLFYRMLGVHKTIDDAIYNGAVTRNASATPQSQ